MLIVGRKGVEEGINEEGGLISVLIKILRHLGHVNPNDLFSKA